MALLPLAQTLLTDRVYANPDEFDKMKTASASIADARQAWPTAFGGLLWKGRHDDKANKERWKWRTTSY